jgi:hypothetical protein
MAFFAFMDFVIVETLQEFGNVPAICALVFI